MHDVDGVNAGYARLLLDEYLENPEAVPAEWRALFEAGDTSLVRELPGLARLLEHLPRDGGNGQTTVATPAKAPAPAAPPASIIPPASGPRRPVSTPSCSAASPRRWPSSKHTGCTAISQRTSTRSGRSRSATRRSTRSASSRS